MPPAIWIWVYTFLLSAGHQRLQVNFLRKTGIFQMFSTAIVVKSVDSDVISGCTFYRSISCWSRNVHSIEHTIARQHLLKQWLIMLDQRSFQFDTL